MKAKYHNPLYIVEEAEARVNKYIADTKAQVRSNRWKGLRIIHHFKSQLECVVCDIAMSEEYSKELKILTTYIDICRREVRVEDFYNSHDLEKLITLIDNMFTDIGTLIAWYIKKNTNELTNGIWE